MKQITFLLAFSFIYLFSFSQKSDEYQVFALKYLDAGKHPASGVAIGGKATDSIHSYFMVWLLKGLNNKNILVDAGYQDTSRVANPKYTRPDLVLKSMNVSADDISDIIITHAHWDHIGGITLFPKAKIWMNKEEYRYFTGDVWQEGGKTKGFKKQDVLNIIEANLAGRLKLVEGDDVEIIPGHDALIFSRFPEVAEGIVKIGN